MNIEWATPIALASWLLVSTAATAADERLPDASFEDWAGTVSETSLSDGSVLFEYSARTFSGSTQGAMLAISFVPRFECSPMVRVRLPKSDLSAEDTGFLEVGLGGDTLEFSTFVDEDDGFYLHALASTSTTIRQLRSIIDVSSRASFRALSEPSSSSSDSSFGTQGGVTAFSLLGSRLATLSAERHCREHEPLEFSPE